MSGTHKNQTDNHRPHSWEFATAGARAAFTGYAAPTTNDLGKWARQLDDNSFWTLTDDSPITWVAVTGGASADDLAAHIATDAAQTVKGHTSWEMIQDMLNSALVAGSGVSITYDDTANTFTIAATGGLTNEAVQDMLATFLVAGANIALTYDDVGNTLTIVADLSSITPGSLGVPRTLGWYIDGDVAIASGYGPIYKLDVDTHITKLLVNVKTAGIGDTHFRMYVSSDLSSWSTVGIITDILVLPSGSKYAEYDYGYTNPGLAYTAGLWLRLDIDAVGGTAPKDATVQAYGHLF